MAIEGAPARFSLRGLLAGFALAPALTAPALPISAQTSTSCDPAQAARAALQDPKGTKLVILGSGGGPSPGRRRRMTSHVMLSGGAAYVLDCGLGVTDQFARTGIPFSALRAIFITHHHPDHNIEYGPLLVIGWIQGTPLSVGAFGPPPLRRMTEDLLRAYETTIGFWSEDLKVAPLVSIDVREVGVAGPVMQDDNVKVSAIIVNHPPVTPALGYRFDFPDRSLAFSGDTTPLEAVARIARGADVLVHEAILPAETEAYMRDAIARGRPGTLEAYMAHMRADHSPVEDVGRIAQEAGVKTLMLSHLVPAIDTIADEVWRAGAAKHFTGQIIVAHDMTVV